MQNAFSAGPLHSSLPTIAAGEPVAGILLGIVVFGDRIQITPGELAIETAGIAALIVGVVLVARSSAFGGLRKITDAIPHHSAHGEGHVHHEQILVRRPDNLRVGPDKPRTRRREELNGLRQDQGLDEAAPLDVSRPRRAHRRPLHGPASGEEGG
jgi:hypothetical protein